MSQLSRITTVSLLSAAVVLALTACGSPSSNSASPSASSGKVDSIAAMVPSSIAEAGSLKIAAAAYAPAVIAPTGGATEPTGWDAEIATAAAGVLGLKADYVMIPFDGIISGLQADRYDAAVGDIGINVDRLNTVSFVKNHYAFDVLVSKADANAPKSFDSETDLCGRTVGVLLGSQEAKYLDTAVAACSTQGLPTPTVSTFQDQATVNLALAQGRVDLNLTDDGSAALMMQQSPGTFATSFAGFVPVLPTGLAFPNNDDTADITAAFAAAIDHLIETGAYDEIMAKWNVGDDGRVAKAEAYSLVVDGARTTVEATREG